MGLQQHRCAVERNAEEWWSRSSAFSAVAVKVDRAVGLLWAKIKDWDTRMIRRLFRRKDEETWSRYRMRTAKAARSVSENDEIALFHEIIAEGRWIVMGWICDRRPTAVLHPVSRLCVEVHRVVENCEGPEFLSWTQTIIRDGCINGDGTPEDASGIRSAAEGWREKTKV